jgi:hypothetical protein
MVALHSTSFQRTLTRGGFGPLNSDRQAKTTTVSFGSDVVGTGSDDIRPISFAEGTETPGFGQIQ